MSVFFVFVGIVRVENVDFQKKNLNVYFPSFSFSFVKPPTGN